jgi:hypothetical protein
VLDIIGGRARFHRPNLLTLSDRKVCFDDCASRSTVEAPRHDAATGAAYTELVTPKVAGAVGDKYRLIDRKRPGY